MKDRPILFSAPMVRAILEGRKCQTRRVVKITHRTPGLAACLEPHDPEEIKPKVAAELCPYGLPGDRLWVKETFKVCPSCGRANFHADQEHCTGCDYFLESWKPSIFMPRSASRIALELTGVRVERLQDITVKDAIAEGLERCKGELETWWGNGLSDETTPFNRCRFLSPVACYRELWEQINGWGSWDANPWVWVLEFKRVDPERSNLAAQRKKPSYGVRAR